jgi:predicted MFS family arabinose efflux permease
MSLAAIGAGALLALAFLRVESRAEQPLMPLELFRSRVFTGTNLVTLFLYGSLSGAMFLLPFDLIARRGLTAAEAGATMLPLGLLIGLLSRRAGSLADRHGPRLFLAGGSLAVAAACAGLALGIDSYWLGVLGPILLMSLGMAAAVSPLTTAVMTSVPDEKSGAASGVNNAASRLAGLLAVALLGALASFLYSRGLQHEVTFGVLPDMGHPDRESLEAAFHMAYSAAMWASAAAAGLAAITAWISLSAAPRPGSGLKA